MCQVTQVLIEDLDQHAQLRGVSVVIIRTQPVNVLNGLIVTVLRDRLQEHAFPDAFIGVIAIRPEAVIDGIE